jgi:hypothetical protein
MLFLYSLTKAHAIETDQARLSQFQTTMLKRFK